MQTPSFLELSHERRIAYYKHEGQGPYVIFMGGFMSDMTGSKAIALESFCKTQKQSFIRFDYSGHGQSSGEFRGGTIGSWAEDTLAVIDQLGGDDNILIGSSMGGWIMLLAALARPKKVSALIGIAAAPDFTERLMWQQMDKTQQQTIQEHGEILYPNCYGEEPYPITKHLIEDGRKRLLLDAPIALDMPVRLIHGMQDEDVPWQTALALTERLQSDDVQLQLLKNAGHRLSEPPHLDIILKTLADLLTLE